MDESEANRRPLRTFVDVGTRRIDQTSCLVIAEAGVNHDGDVRKAHALVAAAREAGADAVKFQTWITDELVVPGPQHDLLKPLELPASAFVELKTAAESAGLIFLSTPDEESSADLLERLGVPAFKIGSAEITNLPFLKHVASKHRPIILSTGTATLDEVRDAVHAITQTGNDRIVLLHCVSQYPANGDDINLRAIGTLRAAFGCPIGFSDHTMGREMTVAAVACGACVIEKHLTLDRSGPGPDHAASLEPREFADLVAAVRRVERALGDGEKRPAASELAIRAVVRKVLVAARSLPRGHILSESDVLRRRAGAGLPPSALESVVGRRLIRAVAAWSPINFELLE
jgi:sialic acid synthase SpsE